MIRADSTGMATNVSRPMLFDTRRGLYYPKPALRGWLHLLWFEVSLVIGTLLLAHAHGARQIIAVAILAAIVTHLVWMNAPEKLVGAIFIGLGWTAGLAAPAVWVHAGVGPVLLLLAGGVLYTAGAVTYYRRSPDPVPAVFGFHEVFHAYVWAAAACQYVGISLLIH